LGHVQLCLGVILATEQAEKRGGQRNRELLWSTPLSDQLDLRKTSCICSWALSTQQCSVARNPNSSSSFPSLDNIMSYFSKPPLLQHVIPPIIFEVVVDTNEDDVVPVSQLPHLAVDLTDLNAHPSRSTVPRDLAASPRHVMAALAAIGCLHVEIQRY
jgi:hypothetical protein